MRGDVGSNPAQGEFSFKHLFSLKYDYLGCAGSGFLIFCIYIYIYIIHPAVFEFLAPKATIEGVFSRLYCCYGNLLCYGKDNNVFTNSWAVF